VSGSQVHLGSLNLWGIATGEKFWNTRFTWDPVAHTQPARLAYMVSHGLAILAGQ